MEQTSYRTVLQRMQEDKLLAKVSEVEVSSSSVNSPPEIPEHGFQGISFQATKEVYKAGKYDWSAAWVALLAAAPTLFDYLSQILAWMVSSPDAPQIPDQYKAAIHTIAFVLALFTRGMLARRDELPPALPVQ